MRFVEDTKETWTAIQLEAVEKEIEQQKREWEANRLAELQREAEERKNKENEESNLLTYSREDSKNQVNNNKLNNSTSNSRRKVTKAGGSVVDRKGGDVQGLPRNDTKKGDEGSKKSSNLRKSTGNISNNTPITPKKVSPRKIKSPPKSEKRPYNKKSPIKSNHKPPINLRRKRLLSGNNASGGAKKRSLRDSSVTDNENTSDDSDEEPQVSPSDDSECSLDVMIDTTDDPDSDSNHASTNGTLRHTRGSELEEGSTESDKGMRKTRSRGTVKINLWSLAPNPEHALKQQRSTGKVSPGKVPSCKTTTPVRKIRRARIIEESTTSETGSDAGSRSNTPTLKKLKILISKQDQGSDTVSPVPTKKVRKSTGNSGGGGEKSAKNRAKKMRLSGGKNHTLDNWVCRTPKINLSVEDQEACKKASNSEHSDSGTIDLENTEKNGVTPI